MLLLTFLLKFLKELMAVKKSLYSFLQVCSHSISGVMVTEKEGEARAARTAGCPYLQCSLGVPTPSYSAAFSAQRGPSPDSDSVAGPLWGGSGLHVSVGLLPWGGDWGSSPGRPLSALSCRDCSRLQYPLTEGPVCGSINKPALSVHVSISTWVHPLERKSTLLTPTGNSLVSHLMPWSKYSSYPDTLPFNFLKTPS